MTKNSSPKNQPQEKSSNSLGHLIRKARLEQDMSLTDIAKACQCSVQFISNIEHGRAPLPWEKANLLSQMLKIPLEALQIANLAVRSDFKTFVTTYTGKKSARVSSLDTMVGAASAVAFASKDVQLQAVIQKYQMASVNCRKKFVRTAFEMLSS